MIEHMDVFLQALEDTLKYEGGYVNDPLDPGGETNYGITKKTALSFGYHGAMKEMPTETVRQIYCKQYWDAPGLDKLAHYMPELAKYLFDIGVNCGPATAGKFLQTAIKEVGTASSAKNLVVDGQVGPRTVSALWDVPGQDRIKIRASIAAQHENYYRAIVKRNPTQKKFLAGWLKRVRKV